MLFFVGFLLICCAGIAVFPQNGIKVNEGLTLELPTFAELAAPDIQYKNIDSILSLSEQSGTIVPNAEQLLVKRLFKPDSFEFRVSDTYARPVAIDANVGNVACGIEFEANDRDVLHGFFWHLKNSRQKRIRILHYGDSQLEGDRITSFIRTSLQQHFGGGGPGLLPALQPYNYGVTIKQSSRGSWIRYNVMEHDGSLPGRRFGVLAGMSRFSPIRHIGGQPDTSSVTGGGMYQGSVVFRRSPKAYPTNYDITECSMYYGYNQSPVTARLIVNDSLISVKQLPAGNRLNKVSWKVNKPEKIEISLSGNDSPEIYAIGLDDTIGVAVDNIPLRGSAGFMFTPQDKKHLGEMIRMLDVKLIIMEFGGNVTPYITKDYTYYEKNFAKQLAVIREVAPEVSLLVIGPADMSRKQGGNYVSYPNIPLIRDALKRAAFANDAAFWDMYGAMGGKNSMPSWVNANPALAAKDYTHFSTKGAEVISRMFYNALISEYNKYLMQPY